MARCRFCGFGSRHAEVNAFKIYFPPALPKGNVIGRASLPLFLQLFFLWQLNPALVPDSFWNDVRENIFFKNSTPLNRLPGKEGNPVRKPIEEFLGAVTLAPLSRDRIRSTANMGWKH